MMKMKMKGKMDSNFDDLCDVLPGREAWRIKVRVARLWTVQTFMKPDQINSVEMVLIDEKGGKIHATVRKQLLYLFQHMLVEGKVYKIAYFSVAPSVGSYRPTLHPHKIVFHMKTKVSECRSSLISPYGLTFSSISEVCSHTVDYDYLVDVIGVMTGISAERQYVRDGKLTKMIVIELTDQSGKCECALFGSYVDILQEMMGKSSGGLPVVIVQYAKIKIFREKVSIQNVMNTTRLLVNPDIPEAIDFKNGIAVHGIESSEPVPLPGPRVRPSMEDEFLGIYPRKSIAELQGTAEDGIFVVSGIVDGLVEDEEWYYPACTCHRSLMPDSGAYYCKDCVKHVFHMVPRYKVKVYVTDGTHEAVFVLFDSDVNYLIEKQCSILVAAAKAAQSDSYPAELLSLKGTRFLFKVEKDSPSRVLFDGSFRVKRVCKDPQIISRFDDKDADYTPVKSIAKPSEDVVSDVGGGSSAVVQTQGDCSHSVAPTSQLGDDVDLGGDSSSKIAGDEAKGIDKDEADGNVCSQDDVDFVPESQAEEFVSGLIVTPPTDPVPPSRKKRVLRPLRRSLASDFEEDADEASARKSRRIVADSSDDAANEAPARGSKFVVLEDD